MTVDTNATSNIGAVMTAINTSTLDTMMMITEVGRLLPVRSHDHKSQYLSQ